MKRFFFTLVVIIALFSASGCRQPDAAPAALEKIKVYASFYPLYDFSLKIGGDRVEVVNMVPPGVEPHDWEPGPRLVAGLHAADILVYNGLGLEPWVEKITAGIGTEKPLLVNASEGIVPLSGYRHHHDHGEDCDHHHEEDCDHDHGKDCDHHHEEDCHHDHDLPDPHVWLDPLLALQQGKNILEALISVDPSGEQYYRENFALFKSKIERLDADFRSALAKTTRREFVVTHLSFAYLAKRYGLVQLGISGLSPHIEPTPAQLKEIVDFIRSHGIRYVFKEPLASPRLVRTLAAETGAGILTLNPLEGLSEEEMAAGKDYFSVMYENLEQLLVALNE